MLTMSEKVYFFGRSPGVYRKKPRTPYGAGYIPGAACLRTLAGLAWRWTLAGGRLSGLCNRACLRGSYGVLRTLCGCLVSLHGIPQGGCLMRSGAGAVGVGG